MIYLRSGGEDDDGETAAGEGRNGWPEVPHHCLVLYGALAAASLAGVEAVDQSFVDMTAARAGGKVLPKSEKPMHQLDAPKDLSSFSEYLSTSFYYIIGSKSWL